jgi:hypothetical protein
MRDNELMLRETTDGNLTADETLTAVDIGPMGAPLELYVNVPAIAETDDTIDVTLNFQNSHGVTQESKTMKQITAAGLYHTQVFTPWDKLEVVLDVTDADTGSDFNAGTVEVWLAPCGRYTNREAADEAELS